VISLYNLKHFAILLTAVFLSLGIGIAVGFTANSDKVLVEQQKRTIDKLEQDFHQFKNENRARERELEKIKKTRENDYKFLEEFFEMFFKDRLAGKKVAIVEPFDQKDSKDIVNYLQKAGAQVSYITAINANILSENLNKEIAEVLASEDMKQFNSFQGAAAPEFKGIPREPADFFIIVRNVDNPAIEAIADKLLELNKAVALVQRSSLNPAKIKEQKNFIYIDDIDSIMGKYRLMAFLIDKTM
jgi:hypothetical protein